MVPLVVQSWIICLVPELFFVLILNYLHVAFRGHEREGGKNDNYLGELDVLVVRRHQEFDKGGHCMADG